MKEFEVATRIEDDAAVIALRGVRTSRMQSSVRRALRLLHAEAQLGASLE